MFRSEVQAHEATASERSLAEQILSCVSCGPGRSSTLLYARVDLIRGPGGSPPLLEVELTEPSLFLDFSEGGVGRLAEGIALLLVSNRVSVNGTEERMDRLPRSNDAARPTRDHGLQQRLVGGSRR